METFVRSKSARRPRAQKMPGLTVPEFSRATGFPEGTVRRALANNELAYMEFGGLKRIFESEVPRVKRLSEAAE